MNGLEIVIICRCHQKLDIIGAQSFGHATTFDTTTQVLVKPHHCTAAVQIKDDEAVKPS